MKRKLFCALMALSISACATGKEPAVRTVEVRVPIHAPCAIPEPPEPAYADTDEALRQAPNHVERVRLLVMGRLQRIAREAELRAWGRACAS